LETALDEGLVGMERTMPAPSSIRVARVGEVLDGAVVLRVDIQLKY